MTFPTYESTRQIAYTFSIFTLIVFMILVIWLINFCVRYYAPFHCGGHKAYKTREIKMRRPLYLIFSYLLMLPWFMERIWSTFIWYFFYDGDIQWTYVEESIASIHETSTDLKLHFAFWFCFWCFIHLKLFRLWMIRYDFEYDKEQRNIEWKVNLGLRSIKRSSAIIRYRSVLGSTLLMICFQLMIVLINTFLQIFIRLLPMLQEMRYSQYYEQSVALSLLIIELSLFIIIMHKEPMRAINDVHFVREEWLNFAKMCTALLSLYLICLAIWFTTDIYLKPTLVQCGAQMVFNVTLICFGYLDFVWIIREVLAHMPSKQRERVYDDIELEEILECQDGFEAMMRFLVVDGEYLCQNLLCYVECSQFSHKWAPPQPPVQDTVYLNKHRYLPLIWGYCREKSNSFRLYFPDDISLLVLSYYKKLYVPLDVRRSMAHKFLFFEPLLFQSDTQHYRYLIHKYVVETANLKALLSEKLRSKMMNMKYDVADENTANLIDVTNCAREELWDVVQNGFAKFEETRDYLVLAKQMEPDAKHIVYKDVEYCVHLPPIPKATDFDDESLVVLEMGEV